MQTSSDSEKLDFLPLVIRVLIADYLEPRVLITLFKSGQCTWLRVPEQGAVTSAKTAFVHLLSGARLEHELGFQWGLCAQLDRLYRLWTPENDWSQPSLRFTVLQLGMEPRPRILARTLAPLHYRGHFALLLAAAQSVYGVYVVVIVNTELERTGAPNQSDEYDELRLWHYDPSSDCWVQETSLQLNYSEVSFGLAWRHQLFFFPHYSPLSTQLCQLVRFDCERRCWSVELLPSLNMFAVDGFVLHDKIWLLGRNEEFNVYDCQKQSWSFQPSLAEVPGRHPVVC
jgi:hypothetical protein